MITFFNKVANSWIAKLILAVLALSMMAFWGIGGISNTANFDGTAITVGSKKISMEQLLRAFETERIKMTQLMGQSLTPKQAMDMGLLTQVIQQLISDSLQEQIQNDFGLSASNQAVQRYVERHPAFQDNLGHFDQNLFNAYLAQTKMNQAQLAVALQKELATQHLANTIRLIAPAPDALIQYFIHYQNEERNVEALLIEQDKIQLTTLPTSEELKEFYEAYLDEFMMPETRDLNILEVTPALVSKNIPVSQEDLDALYEEKKDSFNTPEKRDVAQIRFNTEASAQEALKTLTTENFDTVAKENGQTTEATNFDQVTQNDLLPELAEAAFKAKKNTLIGPVESSVGWHVLMVKHITPAKIMDKQSVYANLRRQLVQEQTYDKLYQTVRDIDDILGEGNPLSVAAEKLNLPLKTFKAVDISGNSLPQEYQNQELLQQAFVTSRNESTSVIEQENGFLVAEVIDITPVSPKPFESVKAQVRQKWIQEQQASMLPQLVEKALTQIHKGNIPASMGELIVAKHVKRTDAANLPAEALPAIFKQGIGYQDAINIPLDRAQLISVVKKVSHPTGKTTDMTTTKTQVEQEVAEAMYAAILASYSNELGVNVNTEAIQKAFSVYNDEE